MQSGHENGYGKSHRISEKRLRRENMPTIAYEGLKRIAVEQMNAQDYDDPQNSELYQKAPIRNIRERSRYTESFNVKHSSIE